MRRKDVTWTVCGASGDVSFDGAQLAVLMDIRDEMKRLNDLLHCPNFTAIPHKLDAIKTNTAKRKRAKKAVE